MTVRRPFWITSLRSPVLCLALALSGPAACGGSTDTPRPPPEPQQPALPGYYEPPSPGAAGELQAPLDCSERADIELELIEDFELGAAGGWYLSNDVCAECQDYINAANDIRNAGLAAASADELTTLAQLLDDCRPRCTEVFKVPNYFDVPPVAQPIPGGRCDSRYAMHIQGGPFTDWGGNMGFAFSPPLNVTSFDITGEDGAARPARDYQGITFWARLGGPGNNNLRIEVGEMHTDQDYTGAGGGPICTPNTTDANSDEGCDKFGYVAQLGNEWRQFLVPFAEMRQGGWGRPAEYFDLTGLISFSISYAQGTWDFWIDDLSFYRRKQ